MFTKIETVGPTPNALIRMTGCPTPNALVCIADYSIPIALLRIAGRPAPNSLLCISMPYFV